MASAIVDQAPIVSKVDRAVEELRKKHAVKRRALDKCTQETEHLAKHLKRLEETKEKYGDYLATIEEEEHAANVELQKISAEEEKLNDRKKEQRAKLYNLNIFSCHVLNGGHEIITVADGYGGYDAECKHCRTDEAYIVKLDHSRFPLNKDDGEKE